MSGYPDWYHQRRLEITEARLAEAKAEHPIIYYIVAGVAELTLLPFRIKLVWFEIQKRYYKRQLKKEMIQMEHWLKKLREGK